MSHAKPLVLLALSAGVAHAAPLAALTDDQVTATLDHDGVVHLTGAPGGDVKLAPAVSSAQLSSTRYRGVHYVVATITTPGPPGAQDASEAVILGASGGRWHEVLRVPVGGVGLDQDYGTAVAAEADGIYRFQTRGDVRRCDNRPALLFADKFDGTRFRRASALPVMVNDRAVALTARRDPAPAAPPMIYRARAASHEVGIGDAGGLAIPGELDDGRLDTGWHEDLAGSAGEGQFFTFEPRAADARAVQLRIVPGAPTSRDAMHRFNRPRGLAIVTARSETTTTSTPAGTQTQTQTTYPAWRVELPDAAGEPLGTAYVVDLPPPITGCVTVILESTYGAPRGTTAIAELEVFADGERQGGGDALLARVVADGAAGAVNAAAALRPRGAAAVAAIDAALAATTDRGARQRLTLALAGIADPAAAPALVHAATAGWVRDQDLLAVIGALGALGQAPALNDLAAQDSLPVAARVAAVALLPATGPGFARLAELAGRGPAAVRHAVIERLATAPLETLLAAVAAQPAAAAATRPAGDLWRAVTRSAHLAPGGAGPALAAMQAALPAAADYERRYRLVDGVAALGDAAALAELEAWLRAQPATAQTVALRQVAVAGAATNPRPAALRFVVDRARDRDAGVRLAALAALASADGAAIHRAGDASDSVADVTIDEVIGGVVARDAWPEVRRRAVVALGARCQRPGPAQVLGTAVDRDGDAGVRGDALGALVQCHAAGIAARLAQIWNDDRAPVALRSRAVTEATALGEPGLATALVGKLDDWRREATGSADALALAQDAAAAIGQLRPPGAAHALSDALDDAAFPEIVQAAALGLGALGPACPADARAKLAQIAQSDGQAASAAKRAAAQCGR